MALASAPSFSRYQSLMPAVLMRSALAFPEGLNFTGTFRNHLICGEPDAAPTLFADDFAGFLINVPQLVICFLHFGIGRNHGIILIQGNPSLRQRIGGSILRIQGNAKKNRKHNGDALFHPKCPPRMQ